MCGNVAGEGEEEVDGGEVKVEEGRGEVASVGEEEVTCQSVLSLLLFPSPRFLLLSTSFRLLLLGCNMFLTTGIF